jgi:ribonuclease HI
MLLWVPGHVDIIGNKNADIVAKKALNEHRKISSPIPQDLTKWIERKHQ